MPGDRATKPVFIPTGQRVTATAAPGSVLLPLQTRLRSDGNADATWPVTSMLSPDGNILLVLTSGYNKAFSDDRGEAIVHKALDPLTGRPSDVSTPNAEWVFVYDVRHGRPKLRQRINIPNTFNGLAWEHTGNRFYVSGGIDDRVYVFKCEDEGGNFVPDAPFILLGHNSSGSAPLPLRDGGLFKGTKAESGLKQYGMTIGAVVAGVAVTRDGGILYAVNLQNDSLSLVTTADRRVIHEIRFTQPGGKVAQGQTPFWVVLRDSAVGKAPVAYVSSLGDGQVLAIDPRGQVRPIQVGGAPNKMILSTDQRKLYVANGDDDSIDVIDTERNVLANKISLSRPNHTYKGSNPNSLALSGDGATLYVTLGGENAVAVVDLRLAKVIGRIPTGWYPNSVTVGADGKRLYVVNAKSNSGPNTGVMGFDSQYGHPEPPLPNPTHRNDYVYALEKGGLLVLPVPSRAVLAHLSRTVDENNGFTNEAPDPTMTFLRSRIKHVIYIQKENRTYDQILGDLEVGNGDPRLVMFPRAVSPNHHKLALEFVTLDNFYTAGEGSAVGWSWDSTGHTRDSDEKAQAVNYGNAGYGAIGIPINRSLPNTSRSPSPFTVRVTTLLDPSGSSALADADDDAESRAVSPFAKLVSRKQAVGSIWDVVLGAGKSVRDYGYTVDSTYWTPGAPFYIPISRHPFQDRIPQAPPGTRSMREHYDPYYRGFDLTIPDLWRYEEWKREFDVFVANHSLPNFEIICLPMDHFGNFGKNVEGVNTPTLQMADNDYALGKIVEAVSNSPYWEDTAILVLEDDAQDGPDHVDSHRSPAYVISAYTRRHTVISNRYNSVNMVRTIEELLGTDSMSMNDANARPMSDVFVRTSHLEPYKAVIPGALCAAPVHSDLVPACGDFSVPRTSAVKLQHDSRWWQSATANFDFSRPDAIDSTAFNRILWEGLFGDVSIQRVNPP